MTSALWDFAVSEMVWACAVKEIYLMLITLSDYRSDGYYPNL